MGWRDGTAGKMTGHQACLPEFSLQDAHGSGRELTPSNCPLTYVSEPSAQTINKENLI